jgi:uncharacterized protein YkwD
MRISAWKKHETTIAAISFLVLSVLIIVVSITYVSSLKELTQPNATVITQNSVKGVSNIPIPILSPTEQPRMTTIPSPTVTLTTTQRALQSLNNYRMKNGKTALVLDTKLQAFAESRAQQFSREGSMDNHAGFQAQLTAEGFTSLGFDALGENSSFGEWENTDNLIEHIYAYSTHHNNSQLSEEWSHVGIGISGVATNFVFGGKKR